MINISKIFGVENKMVELPAEDVVKTKDAMELAKILEQAKPPEVDKESGWMNLPLAKAVIDKATGNIDLLSTTNINKKERWELIKLRAAFHYSHNPICLIIGDSHMKLNRSLTPYPKNVLTGLFGLINPNNINEDEEGRVGRWGRLRQAVWGE